jgi:uncharacterized membrane protein
MKIKLILILVMILIVGVGSYFAFFQDQPPIVKTQEITLTVRPAPDFILETSMGHIDTFINRTIAFAVTVTSINEFAGEVSFEVTGLPPEFVISYFPGQTLTLGPDSPKGIQVDIVVPDDVSVVGDYSIVVTATSMTYN